MGSASLLLTVVSLVIALQVSTQTDGSSDNSLLGCILDGQTLPVGSLTSANRCLQYRCDNNGWRYKNIIPGCQSRECSTTKNTDITMYEEHKINGNSISTYHFDGPAGTYSFTQSGIKANPQIRVNATFKYTDVNATKTSITHVAYREPGITVEFVSPGPTHDAKLLVNGVEPSRLGHKGVMQPFTSENGAVYISNDSPNWPRPNFGGNIHIVGSLGISTTIYALWGYAHFVHTYAMPAMNDLYGLCDVISTPQDIDPNAYTKRDGNLTVDINEFINSWKFKSPCDTNDSLNTAVGTKCLTGLLNAPTSRRETCMSDLCAHPNIEAEVESLCCCEACCGGPDPLICCAICALE